MTAPISNGPTTHGYTTMRDATPAAPQHKEQYEILMSRSGLLPVAEDGPEPNNLHGKERKFYLLGQAIVRSIGNLSR